MSDDAEYDDDCLHCCLARAAPFPYQCFEWAADGTSDSVRCPACQVAIGPAVDWALEVERFAVGRAEPLKPEQSHCGTYAMSERHRFSSASLVHAEDAEAVERHACEEPAVAHESQQQLLAATRLTVA